ncbi:MAG: PEGA domain-containing protein [Candidatus Acidiferrales bacterium]
MSRNLCPHWLGRFLPGLLAVAAILTVSLLPGTLSAQSQQSATTPNQVMGQVEFVGKTKPEKTAGVWVDGQYVGYVSELKGDKKVLLLPGEHAISVRQTGYLNSDQKIVTEPGKKTILTVTLERDPKAMFSASNAQVKLKVTPERAAVFVDGKFAGTANQFQGVGRAMLIAPGKHHIRIGLAGYQPFETDVSLDPNQKMTVKTDLVEGSIEQAGPAIKSN